MLKNTSTLLLALQCKLIFILLGHSILGLSQSSQSVQISEEIHLLKESIYQNLEDKKFDLVENQLDSIPHILGPEPSILLKLKAQNISNYALAEMNQFEKVKNLLDDSFKLIAQEQIQDSVEVEMTYFVYTIYLYNTGKYEEFETVMDSCFLLLKREDEEYEVKYGKRAADKGVNTYMLGDKRGCIDWQKKGLEVLLNKQIKNNKDSIQIGNLYNNVAFVYWDIGRFDEVEPNFVEGLKFDSLNHGIRGNLIRFWELNNKNNKAINLAKENLTILPKTNYFSRGQCYTTLLIGNMKLYRDTGDSTYMMNVHDAYEKLKSESIYSKPNDYPFEANFAGLMCDFYSRIAHTMDIEKAQLYLDQQVQLFEKSNYNENSRLYKQLNSNIKQKKSNLLHRNKKYAEAHRYINSFMNEKLGAPEKGIAEPDVSAENLLDKFIRNVVFNKQLNDLALSQQSNEPHLYLDRVEDMYSKVDSSIKNLISQNELEIESIEFKEHKTIGVASSVYHFQNTMERKYLDSIFQRIESMRSLDLFRHHIQSRIKKGNENELSLFKESLLLRDQIETLKKEKELNEIDFQQSVLDSLNTEYVKVKELQGTELKSFKNSNLNLLSLNEFQQKIDSNECYIFLVDQKFAHKVYGILIKKETALPIAISYENLEADVYQVNRSISNPQNDDYKDLLRHLYDQLLFPFESHFEEKNLVFGTAGITTLIPFDLLMNKKNEYLCFQKNIRYSYSESWTNQNVGKQNTKKGIVGLSSFYDSNGETDSRNGFDHLDAAIKETDFLRKEFGAKTLTMKEANKESFLKNAAQASIIHLAMHNDYNPIDPLNSSLVFSENKSENLYMHEIDDLSLNADLLTLSACNTGKGRIVGAGNMVSLARSFAYAGCSNILQSLWSVNDESTFHLMKSFYTNLDEGITIPAALAQAKKNFYENSPAKWKHPYYWGGFIYSGDDIQIDLGNRNYLSFGFISLSLLLIIIVAIFKSVL